MKIDFLKEYEFFTGVPDSQLKPLCNYLLNTFGVSKNHIIAANEGNCVALAAGYFLATGKIPVVYMQNSGIGNAINPIVSLLNNRVYEIPCVFVIGWRGEPGIHDEPQHVYQGEITIKLLNDIGVKTFIIRENTTQTDISLYKDTIDELLKEGKSVAFIICKDSLEYFEDNKSQNAYIMKREEAIEHIVNLVEDDIIISTTGKTSRELFEIREKRYEGHQCDFLTVGSMGHSSSIAMGIALQKPYRKIWCIDGDGAAIMHMGAMAVIGAYAPSNMIHIIINNEAHESVGGMPTVSKNIDFLKIAQGCGYINTVTVNDLLELDREVKKARTVNQLSLIEIKVALGAREDLGRPSVSPKDNKLQFMKELSR